MKKLIINDTQEDNDDVSDLYAATSDAADHVFGSPPIAPLVAVAGGSIEQGDGDVGSSLQSTPRMKIGELPGGPLMIRR